jgi:hypothetical protein
MVPAKQFGDGHQAFVIRNSFCAARVLGAMAPGGPMLISILQAV